MSDAVDADEAPTSDIRYERKNLSTDERLRMLVETGGRCTLCNVYLLEGELSYHPANLWELAHIIGLQPNEHSPRGLDEDLTEAERNAPENLMVVCSSNHREIDKAGSRDMHPTDWLRQRKADHLERIRYVTGLDPRSPTVPLRVIAKVRDDLVEVDRDAVARAVMYSGMRYPKFRLTDRNAIEIDLRHIPAENDAGPAYYAQATAIIDEVFDHTLTAGWKNEDIRHMSVFAFARIPLLVYLGYKFGDHFPVDIYQRNKITQDWQWPSKDRGDLTFDVDVPPTTDKLTEAVLVINVSGTINIDELPETVADLPVLSITAGERDPNILDSPAKLDAFTAACHKLLGKIEADGYKTVDRLHVFASMPLSCAVAFGRAFDDDVHPSLAIYDRLDGTGYQFGLQVGHRYPQPDCQSPQG